MEQSNWHSDNSWLPGGNRGLSARQRVQSIRRIDFLRESGAPRRRVNDRRHSVPLDFCEQLHSAPDDGPLLQPALFQCDTRGHEQLLEAARNQSILRLPTFLLHVLAMPIDRGDKRTPTVNR